MFVDLCSAVTLAPLARWDPLGPLACALVCCPVLHLCAGPTVIQLTALGSPHCQWDRVSRVPEQEREGEGNTIPSAKGAVCSHAGHFSVPADVLHGAVFPMGECTPSTLLCCVASSRCLCSLAGR